MLRVEKLAALAPKSDQIHPPPASGAPVHNTLCLKRHRFVESGSICVLRGQIIINIYVGPLGGMRGGEIQVEEVVTVKQL